MTSIIYCPRCGRSGLFSRLPRDKWGREDKYAQPLLICSGCGWRGRVNTFALPKPGRERGQTAIIPPNTS